MFPESDIDPGAGRRMIVHSQNSVAADIERKPVIRIRFQFAFQRLHHTGPFPFLHLGETQGLSAVNEMFLIQRDRTFIRIRLRDAPSAAGENPGAFLFPEEIGIEQQGFFCGPGNKKQAAEILGFMESAYPLG